jgi:hypothetical protein
VGRARSPHVPCAHCGTARACTTVILEQRVCRPCTLRFRRRPGTCPGCDEAMVLAFYDPQRRPSCAACTGNEPVYGCAECGREDNSFGTKCGPCTLTERLTTLLSDPTGRIHPSLQPVFDTLNTGPRSQTTLYWLTRQSSRPDILQSMARGELDISHAAFETLPATRAVGYLRDLLAALDVIPPYQPALERVTPWLRDLLTGLPKDHADLIDRFARWQLLRRLRVFGQRDHGRRVTRSGVQGARAAILGAARFLGWLDSEDISLVELSQPDLERYLVHRPGHGPIVKPFLDWTARTAITGRLQLPNPGRPAPEVVLSDERRWQQVERLLHDDTIRRYVRIGGLFMLLWAQPLSRICRMRADQVTDVDGIVSVRFDTVPIEVPNPLDELVRDHLTRRGQASYASRPDQWLFPGGLPGKHLVTENIRSQLVAQGVQPSHARKAALFQLAAEVPAPILAELLGLSIGTATRWATLAARDWSQYTAMRRESALDA